MTTKKEEHVQRKWERRGDWKKCEKKTETSVDRNVTHSVRLNYGRELQALKINQTTSLFAIHFDVDTKCICLHTNDLVENANEKNEIYLSRGHDLWRCRLSSARHTYTCACIASSKQFKTQFCIAEMYCITRSWTNNRRMYKAIVDRIQIDEEQINQWKYCIRIENCLANFFLLREWNILLHIFIRTKLAKLNGAFCEKGCTNRRVWD